MRQEWEPNLHERVVDLRRDTRGAVGEVVRCDRYGHFADPYWRAAVRWSSSRVEDNIPTVWLALIDHYRQEPTT